MLKETAGIQDAIPCPGTCFLYNEQTFHGVAFRNWSCNSMFECRANITMPDMLSQMVQETNIAELNPLLMQQQNNSRIYITICIRLKLSAFGATGVRNEQRI